MTSQGSSDRPSVPRRPLKRRSGFSLIELIIVVGVVGILATITVGVYAQWIPRMRLRGTAEEVAVVMQRARLHAIRTNQRVTVKLVSAAAPAIDQWVIAWPEAGSIDKPILRVTIPKSANETARMIAISSFTNDELVYRGDGTIETMGWIEVADQKDPPNRLQLALENLSGSQPKLRKFLIDGDAPGGTAGFFEQTISGPDGKNVWVWY